MSYRYGDTKFLESVSNLHRAIKRASGRSPSAEVVRDVSACLQQGRLFFEAASEAPLQIRPLQIFYGMVGFSKAVVLARNVRSISTLVQAHGLSDISPDNATIAGMRLKFQANGIFQQFNDAVAPLGSIRYFDNSMRQKAIKPFDVASGLSNSDCSLTDLLGRIPGLEELYHRTFDAKPECWRLGVQYNDRQVDLRIDDPVLFQTMDELRAIVESWRSRFPWLQQWCFARGTRAWDNTVLIFRNREKPQSGELSDANLIPGNEGFDAVTHGEQDIDFIDILPALAGGVTGDHPTMISPLNGVAVSEFSIQFATAFLLSSLVRYRPQIWQHALAHTHTPNTIADDATLSLIEAFMSIVLRTVPQMVEECIDPTS